MRIRSHRSLVLGTALSAALALGKVARPAHAAIAIGGDVLPEYPSEAPNPWGISGSLFVGYSGSGSVTLEVVSLEDIPGVIHTSTAAYIGYLDTAEGTMTIDGPGTALFSMGTLAVGHLGTGTLTIENGGHASNGVGRVGVNVDSHGDVTVRGLNSQWLNFSTVEVGVSGIGNVTLEAGGYIQSANVVYLGYFAGGKGTVTVRGTSSMWWAEGAFRVGYTGEGALTIRSGGHVRSDDGQIANTASASGSARVTGTDSRWQIVNDLRLGPGGIGVLDIEDGGLVDIGDQLFIGYPDTVNLDGGTLRVRTFERPLTSGPQRGQFHWRGGRVETDSVVWSMINDAGTLAPGRPHAIADANDYSQGPGGTLEIEIAGLDAGTEYDRLVAKDTLRCGGTLRVVLRDGFEPAAGETFDILDWSKRQGIFAVIELPALPAPLQWDLRRLYVDGTLGVLPDRDGDGLADTWEGPGNGVPVPGGGLYSLPGSDPDHKDVYVEIDAMDELAPLALALDDVVAAFAAVPNAQLVPANPDGLDGITLHLQLDELALPAVPWANPAWANFDATKVARFGTLAERADPNVIAAKAEAYRYCIFAERQGETGSSGFSELPGNDFMVTLGDFTPRGGTRNMQAGTFMHELGHTLGLRHGGGDEVNFKPNYFSVMNYLWQFPEAFYAGSWVLDYSRSPVLAPLDETALDEPAGLPGPAGRRVPVGPPIPRTGVGRLETVGPNVDFDRDGDATDAAASADVNNVFAGEPQPADADPLMGFADWPNLLYLPSHLPDWNASGVHASSPTHELTVAAQQALELIGDCNENGILDDDDITGGFSQDADGDGIPDECESGVSVPPRVGGLSLSVSPNPAWGGRADVRFELASPRAVRVTIHDVSGRRVATLASGVLGGGPHVLRWSGRDLAGNDVPAGVYFARLSSIGLERVVRFAILR